MTDPTDLSSAIDQLAGAHVMVIGDLMLDRFVYGEVERISPDSVMVGEHGFKMVNYSDLDFEMTEIH